MQTDRASGKKKKYEMRALIFRISLWPNAAAALPEHKPVAPIWCSFPWLQGTYPKVEMQISSLSQRGLNQPLDREECLGRDRCQQICRETGVFREHPCQSNVSSFHQISPALIYSHDFFFFLNTPTHTLKTCSIKLYLLLFQYDVALSWITNRLIIKMSILSL